MHGQKDVPLSDTGIRQARLVGQRLKDETFTHVFSSDLSRAYQTAQTIVDINRTKDITIIKDERLRERNLGIYEGKSSQEFIDAAKAAHKKPIHTYTPPGGESLQQINQRAISFFTDLCKQLVAFVKEKEDRDYIPGSIKRKREEGIVHNPCNHNVGSHDHHSCQSLVTDNGNTTSESSNRTCDGDSLRLDSRENVASNNVPNGCCPNVTFSSPHCDNRLSSVSSISSGRNSSYDEMSSPCPADVLIINHGGLINVLLLHLVDDLGCIVPGGRNMVTRIGPNCTISKFTVNTSDSDEKPSVTCNLLYDQDHLNGTDFVQSVYSL